MPTAPTRRLCDGHRKDGAPCGGWAMRGKAKCHMHGGKSPAGIASPHFRTGKYSSLLPLRLAAAYDAARNDPDIHSLAEEIALAETRLRDLLTRLDTSDLGHAWVMLAAAWRDFARCRSAGDIPGMQKALSIIEPIVKRGEVDYLLWQEITDTARLLAQLRLQEHRRLVDLESMMTAERANVLFGLLLRTVHSAVIEHADPATARRILTAVQATVRTLDTRPVAGAGVLRPDPPADPAAAAALA